MYFSFYSELNSVLSIMQASHKGTDIKHRTWMLRSLITHVNTDSVISDTLKFLFVLVETSNLEIFFETVMFML